MDKLDSKEKRLDLSYFFSISHYTKHIFKVSVLRFFHARTLHLNCD